MYVRTVPLGQYPRRRYLGAVAGKPSEGAILKSAAPGLIGTGLSTGLVTSGLLTAGVAGPIGIAAALAVELAMNLNHPHGTCAPNAPDMLSFLKCWSHPVPANLMPIWTDMWGGSDGKGWINCAGASGGRPPSTGCEGSWTEEVGSPFTDPPGSPSACGSNGLIINPTTGMAKIVKATGNTMACAPPGTIASTKGGGFQVDPIAAAAGGISGGLLSGSIAGIPTWMLLAGGALVLVFAMRR